MDDVIDNKDKEHEDDDTNDGEAVDGKKDEHNDNDAEEEVENNDIDVINDNSDK